MAKPVMPKLVQGDDETNLDFGLRQAAAKREYRKALRRWREAGGEDAPTAEAADAPAATENAEGLDRITEYRGGRRDAIEKALAEAEGN